MPILSLVLDTYKSSRALLILTSISPDGNFQKQSWDAADPRTFLQGDDCALAKSTLNITKWVA